MKAHLINALFLSSILAGSAAADHHEKGEGWADLFNGKDLTGFTQKNGTATYEVKDGTILGTTAKGPRYSCTMWGRQWNEWQWTLPGRFPPTSRGNRYICVAMDYFY